MTPPYERLLGRAAPTSEVPELPGSELPRSPVPADTSLLNMTTALHNRFTQAMTEQELARILPEGSEADGEALQEALNWSLQQARGGDARMYITFMRLMAGIVSGMPAENQPEIRGQLLELVPEALQALQNAELPSRDRVTRLYELTMAVAGAFARDSRESPPEAESRAMLSLFQAVQQAIAAHNEAIEANPRLIANPPYMRTFCLAQIAMLSGNAEEALRQLLETRRIIRSLPESTTPGIRNQIALSTELALQALPRDPSGLTAQAFRGRVAWELLSYFYQVDYVGEHGEGEMETAQRRAQHFNLIAGLVEDYGVEIGDNQEFGETETQGLVQVLETLYTKNEDFERLAGTMGLGELDTVEHRATAWGRLIDNAEGVFRHIHEHREAAPYQPVLNWAREQDLVARIATQLDGNQELKAAVAERVGGNAEVPSEALVQVLAEYGPLLSTLLDTIPEATRNAEGNRSTLDLLRQLGQGLNEDEGVRHSITEPMESFFEVVGSLPANNPEYAPAFAAIYQSLSDLEHIVPNQDFPAALRTRASRELQEYQGFSWRRVVGHLSEPESIAMVIGGALFTEWASGWMLARAGAAGEWGSLVRGGQLTWRGEAAIGMGVAFGMSTFGTITHLANSDRPMGEEFGRILPGVAMGTLVNGLALAGTMGMSYGLRRGILSESRIASPLLRGSLHRLANIGLGGGLMLGGNAITRGIMTGRWESPGSEEIAETFLMMAAFDLTAAGLRRIGSRFWWRRQLGPHRSQAVEVLARRCHAANPQIEEAFFRNYLGMRMARGRGVTDISQALRQGREPFLEGSGSSRTLVFRRPAEGGESGGGGRRRPTPPPEISAVARSFIESEEFQGAMDSIHREVVNRLRRNPELESIWIDIDPQGNFRVLNGESSGIPRDPRRTFSMGPNSVPQNIDGLEYPMIREALGEYGRQLQESGRADLRLRSFERTVRGRVPSRPRLGGGGEEMSRTEAARVILDLTPADQAVVLELANSPTFRDQWRDLLRQVQEHWNGAAWVRGTRVGSTVIFIPQDAQPATATSDVAFRLDAGGRITHMSEGDAVLRAVLQVIQQNPILPPSAGIEAGGRADREDGTRPFRVEREDSRDGSRDGSPDEAARVEDDVEVVGDEVLEEILSSGEGGTETLRPAPVPPEARAIPPALPRRTGGGSGASPPPRRPGSDSPRPSRLAEPDPTATETVDLGSLLSTDSLAAAGDSLIAQAEGQASDIMTVRINPNSRPGEDLFSIVTGTVRLDPNQGFFILRRVPTTTASGTINGYVLVGEPVLPPSLRNTDLAALLRALFSESSMGFHRGK